MLGLPDDIRGLLFDMDGVLTRTAEVHARAWKQTFDTFLKRHDGDDFTAFDEVSDYDAYVDGKPRLDGVRDFLSSRDITLPEGEPDDPVDADTIYGVGNAKQEILIKVIHAHGVKPYEGSLKYVTAALDAGLACAVVSSSANAHDVLSASGFSELITTVIDGTVLAQEKLAGKPHPDTFLHGAKLIGVEPAHAAVFEDALAGVQAGRAGGFGAVVGVDRAGQADALAEHGATIVIGDLSELLAP